LKILAATSNEHKLKEFRQILEPLGFEILSAEDIGGIPDVEETGTSFEENAILKAKAVAEATGHCVIADDSGLEVYSLDGEPGIHSARYAGDDASDLDRMAKLLDALADKADRSARFVCVIAIAGPDSVYGIAEGEVKGLIATEAKGENGFGYDPLFLPVGELRTFAEMAPEEKDSISHRARALIAACDQNIFERIKE
jgi:XTP/dITP diphosphohydrolase